MWDGDKNHFPFSDPRFRGPLRKDDESLNLEQMRSDYERDAKHNMELRIEMRNQGSPRTATLQNLYLPFAPSIIQRQHAAMHGISCVALQYPSYRVRGSIPASH